MSFVLTIRQGRSTPKFGYLRLIQGGYNNNGKFVLCLKAEHEIDSCYDETTDILNLLNEKAKEELEYIWTVQVYDMDDEIYCESSDLKVYDEASSC